MTTLILQLTPVMAKRVAKAADVLQLRTHEDVGLAAVALFLQSILGPVRGRRPQSRAPVAKKASRARGHQ